MAAWYLDDFPLLALDKEDRSMAQLLTILVAMVALVFTVAAADNATLPPRIASGDITSTGAVVWDESIRWLR